MPLPAQFQIGLELTNLVNPVSQALSALSSLALVDAIKKAGSDAVTEMKLASLIGRHRIDEVMKWHFREKVAKSDRSILSTYVDIMLESGAGPTVQEALKNPALFSMVIQLSALGFAFDPESLANGIVEAIERIVKDSGRGMEIVPDYVSLLGTIRACQQQTAAFQWAPLFEDVEWRLEKAITKDNTKDFTTAKQEPKIYVSGRVLPPHLSSIHVRALPFAVLQSLIMWLQSLQSFPEHRLLHVRCDRGISMAVVWCHHLLGLNISVKIQGIEVFFGRGSANIMLEECDSESVGASLMDPIEPNEPLFSLTKDENHPGGSYDCRAEAFGFGLKILKNTMGNTGDIAYCIHWIIGRALPVECVEAAYESCSFCYHHVTDREPESHQCLLLAARFMFAEENIDMAFASSLSHAEFGCPILSDKDMLALTALLLAFACIEVEDLEKIRHLPLSLKEYEQMRKNAYESIPFIFQGNVHDPHFGRFGSPTSVIAAFSILSHLLVDRTYDQDYFNAVLISARGWSIFFDCIDATDPADVPVDKIRVVLGVPTRRGQRRTRIIDGPVGLERLHFAKEIRVGDRNVVSFPGTSTTRKGKPLVGHHADAFQVTQPLIWNPMDEDLHIYRLAFKRRLDQCATNTFLLKPCDCIEKVAREANLAWIDESLKNVPSNSSSGVESNNPKNQDDEGSERELEERQRNLDASGLCIYSANENPSARWLMLSEYLFLLESPPI